jgi:hypothetical protein
MSDTMKAWPCVPGDGTSRELEEPGLFLLGDSRLKGWRSVKNQQEDSKDPANRRTTSSTPEAFFQSVSEVGMRRYFDHGD